MGSRYATFERAGVFVLLQGTAFFFVFLLVSCISTVFAEGLEFPALDPGPAQCQVAADQFTLENAVLAMRWRLDHDQFRPVMARDKLSGKVLLLDTAECFQIILANSPLPENRTLKASEMRVLGTPRVEVIKPKDNSPRRADLCPGKQIAVSFVSPDGDVEVEWRALLRDGANYVQQRLAVQATKAPIEVKEIVLWDLAAHNARVVGAVDGSPVVAGTFFFGFEHPMARSAIRSAKAADQLKHCCCAYSCNVLARPKERHEFSSVLGVSPEGQLRRSFLFYLERERAQPYRPLLHYNNGSEIGCEYWRRKLQNQTEEARQFRRNQEQAWLANIQAFGEELVVKRRVTIDSFAHDFEWDDESLVWQFHEGYPQGFAPAERAARKYGAGVGVWLSPAGGYPCKPARIEYGQKQGFETNANGLSLAGPRYYARVRTMCVNFVRHYGVNYFKFDGFGMGNNPPGAGMFASDVEALLRLMAELRQLKPTVFFNPSTGSWPSPFWLLHADSIWRQGSDTSVLGKGSDRQRWITYRDSEIYHGVLERAPLYPINSLMIHGVFVNGLPLFGNPYDPKTPRPTYDPAEITSEIRSFFGAGVNLQELYIEPKLMTPMTWDALAEAARWSRDNQDVFVDTHWVGGDPAKGQVYGFASWTKRKAILVLRNPDDKPAEIAIEPRKAFELPQGVRQRYALKSPWKEEASSPSITLAADEARVFTLKPFEVRVFDATPINP